MTTDARIASMRRQIDKIDEELLALLNRRVEFVLEVGARKRSLDLPIYDPERESNLIELLLGQNPGPLDEAAVRGIFERLVDECRRIESSTPASGETEP